MPVRITTPLDSIQAHINQGIDNAKKAIINTLRYVGEQCIIEARNNGNYEDRTGNLRSSIGYAVVDNGAIVTIVNAPRVGRSDKGSKEADEYLHRRASLAPKNGIALIVTAGMNYAEYVEAKGYVVLSSAEEIAPKLVKDMLLKVGFTVK